jgi:hypothetical protein
MGGATASPTGRSGLEVERIQPPRQEPMANQGRSLTAKQILKIIDLLASTEMNIAQIAERMQCSKSAVLAVNRKHGVRDYSGQRSRWKVRSHKKIDVKSRVS